MGLNSTKAAAKDLRAGLAELEISSSEACIDALVDLACLLASWSTRISLTGHRGPEQIIRGLILESLALGKMLPPWNSLADLGSGAGFPGLPIATLWPDREVVLVESRAKRVHFQRAAIRKLGLVNATPLQGRAEDLEPRPSDVVVAMAMAKPEMAIAFMEPWVGNQGFLALPLGSSRPRIEAPDGFEYHGITTYSLPLSGLPRAIWLARRVSEPPFGPE